MTRSFSCVSGGAARNGSSDRNGIVETPKKRGHRTLLRPGAKSLLAVGSLVVGFRFRVLLCPSGAGGAIVGFPIFQGFFAFGRLRPLDYLSGEAVRGRIEDQEQFGVLVFLLGGGHIATSSFISSRAGLGT